MQTDAERGSGASVVIRPTAGDVLRIAQHDVIVARVINAWKLGGFPTWEEAMVAAVVYLAESRRELLDAAVDAAMRAPVSVSVTRSG